MIMLPAVKIVAGFLLDLLLGDSYTFPHPVRFIGKYIELLEKFLRKFKSERISGIFLTIIVVLTSFVLTYYISSVSVVIEIILIYTIFAARSLAEEAKAVYQYLDADNLKAARKHIAFLVSRDTKNMQERDIIRAAVETVSENIVDGIISPMFYVLIGGAPLGMAYKAASTLDSMVGYKNDKYIRFGWASARLDDVLNYIPARITAFALIPAAAFICRLDVKNCMRVMLRDRLNHSSPNSAHSESAVAGALGVQLGGTTSYFGKLVDKPTIGDPLRKLEKEDILRSIRIMYATAIIGLVLGCMVFVFILMLR
jgi:adenosylcobinamide-phosphate synthase